MKKKERDVLSIEIQYDYAEELDVLVESEDFHKLLLDEAIATIEHALDKKRPSARVCYIPNLESSVVLEENSFNDVLDTAIKFYEQQEDYTKCGELVNLKKQVNESRQGNTESN